ncbi:MAG: formate dehydrogenase subunit gamma [Halieaceae bacterium]
MMDRISEIATSMADRPGALLPVLHAIQDEFGYVAPGAVPHIARALNLSRAEVHGVISFYHLIRTEPPGNKVVYLCRAESCQAAGGVALEQHAKQKLGIDYHQTTADGEVSLEPVYCLGNCVCSPSVMVGDKLYSRVNPDSFDDLIDS